MKFTEYIGKCLATKLISFVPELGDKNYSSNELSSIVGIAPYARDSGNKQGRRFIRGGRKIPRNALYMAVLAGKNGFQYLKNFWQRWDIARVKKQLVNKILEKEMESYIGYEKHSKDEKESENRRNGSYEKTIIDEDGRNITVDVPRDREGEFEPLLIPKGVRQFKGFDEKVISLYARGMTTREIQGHLEEIYSTKVSAELISKVTDGVLEDIINWQNRPLDSIYPIIYLDCIHVKGRDNHTIINKAVYIAIGVNMEGKKELLGIWVGKNEGSKFWMQVVTELKNRGIEKIYVACVDGLKGFPEAINSVFPKTIVQLCIVHMVRNSTKYVSYKDLKSVTADLKKIYTAINEAEGIRELQNFSKKWDEKYPVISDMWQRLWSGIAPLFSFPEGIRKAIYTTNTIESANRQIIKDWSVALNQFAILCGTDDQKWANVDQRWTNSDIILHNLSEIKDKSNSLLS